MRKMISLVIPSYNEEDNILHTTHRINEILTAAEIPYEIIFVNDGSKDATWNKILEANATDTHVRGLSFSRNFGKEACMFAGLRAATGDCCVVLDCDLQHPPETIIEMYRLWNEEGYEVIEGVKRSRGKESLGYKLSAGLFYKLMSLCVGFDMASSSDFKLLDRKVVDTLCAMPERETFFRAMSFWVGYKTTKVEYDVAPREFGTTKWSFTKLVKYAVTNMTSFSAAPLHLVTFLGAFLLIVSVILGIHTLFNWALGNAVEGFTTVILLLLLISGCMMISLGIIGYYIAKIHMETKGRPQYIVAHSVSSVVKEEADCHESAARKAV